jgi:hypothetical protein
LPINRHFDLLAPLYDRRFAAAETLALMGSRFRLPEWTRAHAETSQATAWIIASKSAESLPVAIAAGSRN